MPATYRECVESEEYLDQLEKLGAAESDDRLSAIIWSLTVRAEVWPIVPGFRLLRMAKTDAFTSEKGRRKRALRVWFEIRDSHHVDLLYLEEVNDDA